MNTYRSLKRFAALALCLTAATAQAGITDISNTPLVTDAATVTAKPNVMFMLDDSGSMAWDYMPDNAKNFAGKYGFNSNHCNGVYYDPDYTYTPPVKADGTSYPDSSFSAAWKDGYNTGLGTVNLNTGFRGGSGSGSSGISLTAGPAFYYTYTGAQTTEAQMNILNTSSTYYQECNSSIGSAPGNAVFTKTTLSSAAPTATITVSGGGASGATITITAASSARLGTITVSGAGGGQIMSGRSSSSSTTSTVASNIATKINDCTAAATGSCTVSGYSAVAVGNVVTITGPAASGATMTLVMNSGTMTETHTAFPTVTATTVDSITVNGTELLGSSASGASTTALASDIRSKITAAGYSAAVSGSVVTITGPNSAATYTPVTHVASGSMTLAATAFPAIATAAQLTNFANWYSYYSNRMLTMKSGVGLAFSTVTSDYRVGFMTMNNNVSPDIVEIDDFLGGCALGSATCQKDKWYTKLYAASPGNMTPLREALSHVGQLYAHKFGNVTTYSATITVGGSGSTSVSSITVNGVQLMNDASTAATSTATVASNIADQINAMQVTDYGATVSGSVVTIYGTSASVGFTPIITNDGGGMTFTATAFAAHTSTATLNGISPADPVQYSCQQNYVILSTDGYWNGANTYKLDNTSVGQQDGNEPRPLNDGYTLPRQSTSQTLRSTSQINQRTEQLQSRISTLQAQNSQLQTRAGTLQGALSKVLMRCNNTAAACGTAPSTGVANANWSVVTSGSCTTGTNVQCSAVSGLSGNVDVATACNTSANISSAGSSDPSVTITITNSNSASLDRVRGDGTTNTDIASGATSSSSTNNTVASRLATKINDCTASATGSCNLSGHSATVSGNVVTVTGPSITSAFSVRVASGSATVVIAYTAGSTVYTLNNADSNGKIYSACSYSWGGWSNTAAACAVNKSTASPYTVTSATDCQYLDGAWANVVAPASCTAVDKSTASPYTVITSTQCRYSGGAWANASSCTPNISTTSPYTVVTGTECQTTDTGWVPTASCTASSSNGQTITCNTVTTGPTAVQSGTCTNDPTANAGNNYTTTSCSTVTTGPTQVASCTAPAASAPTWVYTTCAAGSSGVSNTLADVAEYYYVTDLRDQSLGNCTGALGSSVCTDNVPPADPDTATWQHMTTFTLGLGARGRMTGADSYKTLTTACTPATDGDYCAVLRGADADGTICTWQTVTNPVSPCNWPTPSSGAIENIDDLWHAAINGRGDYFSARNPSTLASALSTTLNSIGARVGASAAAATSNPNVSSGDNFVFSTSYTSVDWTGELVRQVIDLSTGAVSAGNDWAAQEKLDTLAADISTTGVQGGSRHIYTFNSSATAYVGDTATLNNAKLKSFYYANLDPVTEAPYFQSAHIVGLSQFCAAGAFCLSAADQAAAAGANLVNYLRGDRTNEGALAATNKYYHERAHVLGDIVNAEAGYVKQAQYSYGDINYSDFAALMASRTGMVYAASNDGMLHAFYAGGATVTGGDGSGDEAWAYVPAMVLPNLYKLADKNYSTSHRYYVDGTPITGDVCPNAPASTCAANEWRTILVGGLNLGGRGYYALDVTDPANPQALWEFTDANMGYTFGNPQITKLADGTWVVLVTSGYNNVPNADGAGGDGVGRLYVLNAYTGALIRTISTGVGSTTTPSGLARISARVIDPSSDNTVTEVYGGDLLGNLWRFDVNNNVGSSSTAYEAQLLATFKDATGAGQPITTKPEIGIVSNQVVIFAGTGRFLGSSDMNAPYQTQTMYAVRDTFPTTSTPGTAIFDSPRASACATATSTNCFVRQTVTNTTCPAGSPTAICSSGDSVRTGSHNSVDFSSQYGWFIDFPDSGERDNTDPVLALGTLGFVTNTPSTGSACTVLGYSYRWFLDYRTGAPVATSTTSVLSTKLSSTFATRPVYVRLPTNAIVELTRTSAGSTITSNVPIGNAGGSTRRVSWRELIDQ